MSGLGQQHPLPCTAPRGCGLLAGPPAVPKRPRGGAARHLPGVLAAPSAPTLKVLCSVYQFPSPRCDKGLFPMPRLWCIRSVLLMWLFLWYQAFPLPQAKASVHLTPHLGGPSSSFPSETILLLATWLRLLWKPHIKQLACAWGDVGKEGCPEPRRERQTPAQPWGGGGGGDQDPGCAAWPQTKTLPPWLWFPSSSGGSL